MPNVLVVDDERDLVSLLDFNLRQSGFETTLAYAGEEALNAARRRPPDLVLLDLMLPDMSGTEVCRQLKSDPAPVPSRSSCSPPVGRSSTGWWGSSWGPTTTW